MKPGTVVELPDGRVGTVVYNGLDGVGIKWGRHRLTIDDLRGHGGLFDAESQLVPRNYEWYAEAMLRDPYPLASLPCVGGEFTILEDD